MISIGSLHALASSQHLFRAAGLFLLGANPAHAAVYKCTDATGQVACLDKPCPAMARQQEIQVVQIEAIARALFAQLPARKSQDRGCIPSQRV